MGDKFELPDVVDDKSVIRSQLLQTNVARGPLKTSYSEMDHPPEGLTTYSVSSVLQGAALYKPKGASYDAFNNQLSFELQGLGTEAKWTTRDGKLMPYDIFLKDVDPTTGANIADNSPTSPTQSPGGTGGSAPPLTSGSTDAFAVGDSIMEGCKSYLESNDKGWKFTVDSRVSRPPQEGIEHIKARNGAFGSLVVVNLGTNPATSQPSQWIGEIMQLLSSVPRVCFVTCNECRDYIRTVNIELHNLANRESKVVLVDWASEVAANKGLINGADGIHPTPDGYKRLSSMILDAVGPAPKAP